MEITRVQESEKMKSKKFNYENIRSATFAKFFPKIKSISEN